MSVLILMAVFQLPQQIECRDSLQLPDEATESPDAMECLQGFLWKPNQFTATVAPGTDPEFDVAVRFPSPHPEPGGDVFLEWRRARQADVLCQHACPAVIIVHESGRGMEAGRTIAKVLSRTGVHTFLIHLPGYGERSDRRPDEGSELVAGIRQGAADTRRAADVVKALEGIDADHVSLLGVSLGGFIACMAGSLDSCFDQHFILMAGADLPLMFREGQREVAALRKKVEESLQGDDLAAYLQQVEPARIAHRLPPERTTLYTAMYDVVVPPKCSEKLAETIGLSQEHVIRMPCGHHSAVAFLLPMTFDVSKRARGGVESR